jgi:hypothetical protein
MAKLQKKYIKNKLKAKFGELEVYNPEFEKDIYINLLQMIRDNSVQISENNISDTQINTIKIFREMLINLTNIDEDWNNIDDIKLENMLNLADGDFKKVVNTLMDILLELGRDIRTEDVRKIRILNDKLNEIAEAIRFNSEIDKTLTQFGLDREKLIKLQNGDEEIIKEFQQSLIKQKNNNSKKSKSKAKK